MISKDIILMLLAQVKKATTNQRSYLDLFMVVANFRFSQSLGDGLHYQNQNVFLILSDVFQLI